MRFRLWICLLFRLRFHFFRLFVLVAFEPGENTSFLLWLLYFTLRQILRLLDILLLSHHHILMWLWFNELSSWWLIEGPHLPRLWWLHLWLRVKLLILIGPASIFELEHKIRTSSVLGPLLENHEAVSCTRQRTF
jgi:hypothetical protein